MFGNWTKGRRMTEDEINDRKKKRFAETNKGG